MSMQCMCVGCKTLVATNCKHLNTWFDRTLDYGVDGLGKMCTRCSDCGIDLDEFYKEKQVDGQTKLDGKKNDEGKPMLGLVPKSMIWAIGTILTFGAKLYGEHNWRQGLLWSRPYNALLRHLTAWWNGELLDKESGKSHLWHAATELAFLIEYEESKTGQDDRYRPSK